MTWAIILADLSRTNRRTFYIGYLTSSFSGVLSFTSLKRKQHRSSLKQRNQLMGEMFVAKHSPQCLWNVKGLVLFSIIRCSKLLTQTFDQSKRCLASHGLFRLRFYVITTGLLWTVMWSCMPHFVCGYSWTSPQRPPWGRIYSPL